MLWKQHDNGFVELWETLRADHPHICWSILSAPGVAFTDAVKRDTPRVWTHRDSKWEEEIPPCWVSISAFTLFSSCKGKKICYFLRFLWSSLCVYLMKWLKATVGVLLSPPKSHSLSHDSSGSFMWTLEAGGVELDRKVVVKALLLGLWGVGLFPSYVMQITCLLYSSKKKRRSNFHF